MDDADKLDRLLIAFDRLCKMLQNNAREFPIYRAETDWAEIELIRQYATGQLEQSVEALLKQANV